MVPPSPAGTTILERTDGTPALVRRRCRVRVVEGPDIGREAELDGAVLRVGVAGDNDLVLSDTTVSAHHLELAIGEQGVRLSDLASTNGTFVAGLRVREVVLSDATEIRAGQTLLSLALDEHVEIPLSRRTNFGALLGHSPAMRAVFAILERAAKTDTTVLVLGESGTGKELAARALHDASARREGPYVVFDCGAASSTLVDSQLFGHARGAFTGADEARAGVFEEADGGTLVLDEIGELPLALQPKLLRAIEQRAVVRMGENQARALDVRFVACTNRNLAEEVRAGRFREDLFYRLSVLCVRMPPLRERIDEIPRLTRGFLGALGVDAAIPARTLALLSSHAWPGNVRELRNVVERMVALPDLPPDAWLGRAPEGALASPIDVTLGFHEAKQRCVEAFERTYLVALLDAHAENVSEAARVAGLSRQSCYRLMHKHGLSDRSS